jgi:O-acetylserine/cysteine efflux transporter
LKFFHQATALLVACIWGTNFVFIRYGLDELEPFTFAALRFLLVAFPLILVFPRPETTWLKLAAYGLFIGFGQFGLLYWVMQENITPGLASLLIQMQVFFTVLLALVLAHETIKRQQVVALCLSFSGLALIIFYTDGQTTRLGVAVALLVPVFGMSASAVLLSESMPWWKMLAMVLICSGLALNMLANRKTLPA